MKSIYDRLEKKDLAKGYNLMGWGLGSGWEMGRGVESRSRLSILDFTFFSALIIHIGKLILPMNSKEIYFNTLK